MTFFAVGFWTIRD